MNKVLLGAIAVALVVLAVVSLRSPVPEATVSPSGKAVSGEHLSASAVLKIDPATPSANRAGPRASAPAVSPALQAFRDRKDWVGLYKQLKAAPPSAEGQYLLAELLSACAKSAKATPTSAEQKRAAFLASLPPKDPNLEKRKAAFEQLNNERCGELGNIEYNDADIAQLLQASAAAGDLRARAWLLSREISHGWDNGGRAGYQVTDSQFATIRELLGSQDPDVINEFRPILASTLTGAALRIGPNQEAIDPQAMYSALALVSCDFGAPCGASNPAMLTACANSARCDTGNLYDYTYYYGVSPYAAQLVERYRDWLGQMISTRNFDNLAMVQVPGTPNNVALFTGRRR